MKLFGMLTAAALIFASFAVCSTSDAPYDEHWGADEILGGKADSLYDIARQIEFGDVVTGNVGGDQINVYKMVLYPNDQFLLEETVTSGDLDPHISLFAGASSYVHSQNWEKDGNVLRKWYRVESAGTYLVALRAYQENGRGDYSLTASCLDGPCAGNWTDPGRPMEVGEVNECLLDARECAFERMARYNGAVGPARAQQLLDECLAEGTFGEGWNCSKSCEQEFDDYTEPAEVCDHLVEAIIYYADQSEACLRLLDDCVGMCIDLGDYNWYHEEFGYTEIVTCFIEGLNGNCDGYARNHQTCGGTEYGPDSSGECYEYCYATDGAWVDDLDTMCSDACEEYCEEHQETCETQCQDSDDWYCVYACLEDLDPYCG